MNIELPCLLLPPRILRDIQQHKKLFQSILRGYRYVQDADVVHGHPPFRLGEDLAAGLVAKGCQPHQWSVPGVSS